MLDVVLEVLDEVGVGVVGDDRLLCTAERTHKTGQPCARAKLEHRLALDQAVCMLFQVGCYGSPCIPETVALQPSAAVRGVFLPATPSGNMTHPQWIVPDQADLERTPRLQ